MFLLCYVMLWYYIHIHTYIHVRTYIHTFIYICMYVCIYICVCVCVIGQHSSLQNRKTLRITYVKCDLFIYIFIYSCTVFFIFAGGWTKHMQQVQNICDHYILTNQQCSWYNSENQMVSKCQIYWEFLVHHSIQCYILFVMFFIICLLFNKKAQNKNKYTHEPMIPQTLNLWNLCT